MPEGHVEVERRYDVAAGCVVPDLSVLPETASVEQATESRLSATYFDTEDLRLLHAHVTLHRCTGGGDEGWHLGLPADETSRDELPLPLDASSDETVPQELLDRLRGQLRGRPVRPVAGLRTRRVVRRLFASDGRQLAELRDDEVTAEAHADPEAGSAPTIQWREWRTGPAGASGELLEAMESLLLDAGARPAAGPAGLGRALADRLLPPPGAVGPDGSTGAVLAGYLSTYVQRLLEQDLALRSGDQESGVHQMRIAARRLRSVLATYRPVLDRGRTDPVREDLRWLGAGLAEARDAQVLRRRLTELADAQPTELVLGPVLQRLASELDGRFRAGRERALEVLDTARYLDLLDRLEDLVAAPPFNDTAQEPAGEWLPSLLERDRKRLRRRHKRWRRATGSVAREVALHEVRKAAKRLRYGAESAEPALGDAAGRLAAAAESIQELLGEHQDTVVARPVLRELGVRAHLDGENGFTFGLLHGLEEARAADIVRRYPAAWKKLP